MLASNEANSSPVCGCSVNPNDAPVYGYSRMWYMGEVGWGQDVTTDAQGNVISVDTVGAGPLQGGAESVSWPFALLAPAAEGQEVGPAIIHILADLGFDALVDAVSEGHISFEPFSQQPVLPPISYSSIAPDAPRGETTVWPDGRSATFNPSTGEQWIIGSNGWGWYYGGWYDGRTTYIIPKGYYP
jgi:hypothetical protein